MVFDGGGVGSQDIWPEIPFKIKLEAWNLVALYLDLSFTIV